MLVYNTLHPYMKRWWSHYVYCT